MRKVERCQLGSKEYEIHPNQKGRFTRVNSFNKLPKKGRIRALGAGILALVSQYILPGEQPVLEHYSPNSLENVVSTEKIQAGRCDISSLLSPLNYRPASADALAASKQDYSVVQPDIKSDSPERIRERRIDEMADRHFQDNFPLSYAIMKMNPKDVTPGKNQTIEQNLLRLMQDYPNMTAYIEKTAQEFGIPFSLFAGLVLWESGTEHKHSKGFVEAKDMNSMGFYSTATKSGWVINGGKRQYVPEGRTITSRSRSGAKGAGITTIGVLQWEQDMERGISYRVSGRDIPIAHRNMDEYAANMVVAAHMLCRALGNKTNNNDTSALGNKTNIDTNLYSALVAYNRGEGFLRQEKRNNNIRDCRELQHHIRASFGEEVKAYSEACKMPENVLDIADRLEGLLRETPIAWRDAYGAHHEMNGINPDHYLSEEVARAYHEARRALKPPIFAYRNTASANRDL